MSKKVTPFSGHQPLEKGKYSDIRKFILRWLEDPAIYCNNCGFPYFPGEQACCESPQIGKNLDHCWAVIIQNKARQKTRLNEYASNASKTFRLGVSLPDKLLSDLERFCQSTMGQKLFVNQKDSEFCQRIPLLEDIVCVCRY